MGRLTKREKLRRELLTPSKTKITKTHSQPVPSEKTSTEDFRRMLVVDSPTSSQVQQLYRNRHNEKQTKKSRNLSRRTKARTSTVEKLKLEIKERRKEELRQAVDISVWSRKRSNSECSASDLLCPLAPIQEYSFRKASVVDTIAPPTELRSRSSSRDLFEDFEDNTGGIYMDSNLTDYQAVENQPTVKKDAEIASLGEVLSQLSASGSGDPHPEIPPPSSVRAKVENFHFDRNTSMVMHSLPRMRIQFPVSEKVFSERVANLREHGRALVQGGVPTAVDDVTSLQHQLKLAQGLSKQLLKDLTKLRRKQGQPDILDEDKTDIDVTSALFVTSFKSANKLRVANSILKNAGIKQFASDRAIVSRLKENISWMSWKTETKYVKGAEVIVVKLAEEYIKATNLKEAVSSYINTTWETLDVTTSESRLGLVLRLAVDKGGGVTKICLSVANRKRLTNSPVNSLIVACFNGKDDAFTLRETVPDVFQEFDEIELCDLKLRNEIKDCFECVKRVLLGDLPSIAAVLGLKGHSAKYPCNMCTISKKQLHEKGPTRSYSQTAEEVKFGQESQAYPSLLKNSAPVIPVLHAFQGPVTSLFQKLQEDIKKGIIGERKGIPTNQWFDDNLRVRTLKEVEDELAILDECVKNISKLKPAHRTPATEVECGVWCCQKRKRGPIHWIRCGCGRWYHALCLGMLPSRRDSQLLTDFGPVRKDFDGKQELEDRSLVTCPACDDDPISVKNTLLAIKASQVVLESEKENIRLILDSESTPVFLAWKSTCLECNVLPGQFHGGTLTGNHSRRFLLEWKKFVDVLDLIKGCEDRVKEHSRLLHNLAALHDFTTSTYLNDSQITSIETYQVRLKESILHTKWLSFTPKLHLLCCHMGDVARQFRTVGLHTEQSIEHTHKLFSEEEKNFLQKKKFERPLAVVQRINGSNVERLTNIQCQTHYKTLEFGHHDPIEVRNRDYLSESDSEPEDDTNSIAQYGGFSAGADEDGWETVIEDSDIEGEEFIDLVN